MSEAKETKKETTQEYLASLGLGGTSKRQKKRELEDKEQKKDFTADIDTAFVTIESVSSLEEKINKHLLPLEKKTRLAQDSSACSKVVLKIVELCYEAKEWKKLSEMVTLISKRRSALQKVVYKMVVKTMEYLESAPDKDTKVFLIEALRKVTDGKIFLELEEARLARMLAAIKEELGEITEAANILQEITVETCGSMEAREKAEFMLEQVRLCLAKKDWVRSKILSKKIKRSVLTEQGFHDLKLKHCSLAAEFHIYEDDMFELANDFLSVFNTPSVQENDKEWKSALERVVLYVVLTPFGKDQADLLQRVLREKKIDLLPSFKKLVEKFTTMEICHWTDISKLPDVVNHSLFQGTEWSEKESKEVSSERGSKYLAMLRRRTTEHNIRVISKYYDRIQIVRMASLLSLDVPTLEDVLSTMVSDGVISTKIDRPAGIIKFSNAVTADGLLDEWSSDVTQLLTLVEQTCYLIHREQMIYDTKNDTKK
jgi:26S proteasome regulatory subunit N5